LKDGQTYYVIRVSATKLQLAATKADTSDPRKPILWEPLTLEEETIRRTIATGTHSLTGQGIDLDTGGSGDMHSFRLAIDATGVKGTVHSLLGDGLISKRRMARLHPSGGRTSRASRVLTSAPNRIGHHLRHQ
jgi:hypothetical protein